MSKTLWHTIQIKVPKEMVELTKSGKVSVKKTLTKTLNISRSNKSPAIKLIPSSDNKPHIVNDGKEWDVDVLKERMAKARAMRKKNANKNIFEPAVKRMVNLNKFEGNIIKRARELGAVKKAKKLKTHYQYMSTLDKFRGLENSVLTQANNDPVKRQELINKYSSKIKELKTLLDEYHPDRTESHIFLYEPEYTPPSGYSKRKTATRNRVKPTQTKIIKFGDIRGNMPERKMKGRYDLRSYKPAADDIYTQIIEYYWKHAYEFMEPQEIPTQDELINISKLLYQLTKKYYVVQSRASNGNVKGADELLWDIIDRITNDQYKIIMKVAYHDGINKNHKLLYQACNIHKKKLEDDYNEEVKKINAYREERKNMTPEAKQKEKEFFNKLSRNELIM